MNNADKKQLLIDSAEMMLSNPGARTTGGYDAEKVDEKGDVVVCGMCAVGFMGYVLDVDPMLIAPMALDGTKKDGEWDRIVIANDSAASFLPAVRIMWDMAAKL